MCSPDNALPECDADLYPMREQRPGKRLAELLSDYAQQGLGVDDILGNDDDVLNKLGLASLIKSNAVPTAYSLSGLPSRPAPSHAPTSDLPKHKQQTVLKHQQPESKPDQPASATSKSKTVKQHTQVQEPAKQKNSQEKRKHNKGQPSPSPITTTPAAETGIWQFEVEYSDHFETGQEALEHLCPVLELVASRHPSGAKRPKDLVIYDPVSGDKLYKHRQRQHQYYCKGGVIKHWQGMGYHKVINRNRDFYADIDCGQVPDYDILVTNPPYSADHKERILNFCRASNKPWALLMPNYVANKTYFKGQSTDATTTQQGHAHKRKRQDTQGLPHAQQQQQQQQVSDTFFMVPSQKYEFKHPEGTGHESSPFFSIWFVSLGDPKRTAETCVRLQQRQSSKTGGIRVLTSVEQLRQEGAAPAWKRPNPKQRKKLKQMQNKA